MSSSPPPERGRLGDLANRIHARALDRARAVAPVTLTARLVMVVVALVAILGALVAVATAVATNSILLNQRDATLAQSIAHEEQLPSFAGVPVCPLGGFDQSSRSSFAFNPISGSVTMRAGCAYEVGSSRLIPLDTDAQRTLARTPADGRAHTVNVPGIGDLRVMATSSVIIGLPIADVRQTVHNLTWWELVLTATGVLLAGLIGSELVRRTLRPLRAVTQTAQSVTQQHLAAGETVIEDRVPQRYAKPGSEAGDVAAALNTLLDHVDDALGARHRSEQQVRQFVADASHELRTPLSTIHGYAELARRTPDDAARLATAMAKVETEAQRMSGLVEDLLLLARLDSGRPLARDEVDLTRLLLEAVADARVVAPGHRWQLDLPRDPVVAVGDEQRLHQVITNLLNNARKHTPEGTTVIVSARATPEDVVLVVHDDGPGLPADLVPRAFERFTRGDHSRTRASGGVGLGLSLVSAIVAAHHGRVELTSVPGDTAFTLFVPRC